MAQTVVFFEELRPSHLWLARWYIRRGAMICYWHLHERAEAAPWLRRARAAGRAVAVQWDPPLYRQYNASASLAYEWIERAFGERFIGHPLIRVAVRLYDSEIAAVAFKKHLAVRLAQYFSDALLVERVARQYRAAQRLILVLSDVSRAARFEAYRRMTDPEGARGTAARWTLPRWSRWLGGIILGWERLLLGTLVCAALARCMGQVLWGLVRPMSVRRYHLAMALINPMRELANAIRSVDFLIDGATLRAEEVVCIPVGKVTRHHRRRLRQRGLQVAEPMTPLSRGAGRRAAAAVIAFWRSCWNAPDWMVTAAAALIFDYGRWKGFAEHHRIGWFVTYADFGFRHIGRNILLKRAGVSTLYYMDSANQWCQFTPVGEPAVRVSQIGYLYYDVLVAWNAFLVDYFAAHPQLIGRYEVVGCLWSEHIRLIREGRIPSELPAHARARGWSGRQKVVGVFTSWCHRDEVVTHQDGVAFLEGIERLLEDFPDIFVILKEKHPRGYFARHPVYGGQDAVSIYRFLDRLEQHPRCFLPGFETSAAEVAAMSDLVISFPFTSTSYEPLGAGLKAVFYDPNSKYRGVRYDQFPGYVLHGYPELAHRVAELLYEMTPEQYTAYLEQEIRGHGEPLLDAHALSRFRALILAHLAPGAGAAT